MSRRKSQCTIARNKWNAELKGGGGCENWPTPDCADPGTRLLCRIVDALDRGDLTPARSLARHMIAVKLDPERVTKRQMARSIYHDLLALVSPPKVGT